MLSTEERIKLRDVIFNKLLAIPVIYKSKKSYRVNNMKTFMNAINSDMELSKQYKLYVEQFSSEEEARHCIFHLTDKSKHLCLSCNGYCAFNNKHNIYKTTCGNQQCINALAQTKEAKEKRKLTNLERRGVEYPTQSKEVRDKVQATVERKYGKSHISQVKEIVDKARDTCKKKYGFRYATQSEEVKAKIRETNNKKYGTDWGLQSEEIKDKIKETNKKQYGYENPMQNKNIQKKAQQACMKNFGVCYSMQSKEVRDKARKTMIEKHGVEYATQSEEFQEKIKRTNLERRGVERPAQSLEVLNKMQDTCERKYGAKNVMSLPEFRKKAMDTIEDRFGVKYATQSDEVKNRICKTNMERRGVPYPMQSEDMKNKAKMVFIKKYGVENPSQSEEIKAKIHKTYTERHGISDPISINDIIGIFGNINLTEIYRSDIQFSEFLNIIYSNKQRLLRLKEFAELFNLGNTTIKNRVEKLNLLDLFYIRKFELEAKFQEFLESNSIKFQTHNRTIIAPQEIDFILENSIGIEINEIGSHNVKDKNSQYHLNKTLQAAKSGIQLIHLWEWELIDLKLWDKVSRWILNLCNKQKTKIYARKCNIRLVDINEEKEFLNQYHLQGYKKSEVCYGLYYNNELVQLMSFCKSRYNKNYQYELLRLCTKYGYIITGGANRLLKHFINENNPTSLISYCSHDKFTGKVYEELGFTLIKTSQPQIIWYNPDDGSRFNQSSLNMVGADKLLGTNFGKGISNEEIVRRYGYRAVYNCGLAVYGIMFQI